MVTINQFASTISLIQQAIARVSRRIDRQHALHDKIQDEALYDSLTLPSPLPVYMTDSYARASWSGKGKSPPPPPNLLQYLFLPLMIHVHVWIG